MLLEEIDLALDKGCLLSKEAYHPLPRIDERDVWDNLDPEVKAYYAGQAPALEGRPVAPLTARMYAEFFYSGDRQIFEKAYFDRRKTLFSLAVCECIENRGRFIPDIEDFSSRGISTPRSTRSLGEYSFSSHCSNRSAS